MLESQRRLDIAQNVPRHWRLQSNANCLFGFLRYFISHNLCFAMSIALENMAFLSVCPGLVFFSSDSTIQKPVTADFVSLTTDFRCKLLVTKCQKKLLHHFCSYSGGKKECLRQILEVLGFCIAPQTRWDSSKWTKSVSDILSFLNSRKKEENGKVLMEILSEILSTILYLRRKKTKKACTAIMLNKMKIWKYVLKWRRRLETLFSCFVYKQPVTLVFQRVATNTQPHLFKMR